MKYVLLLALLALSTLSFGQTADKYKKGHHYDLKNNKKEGLIYYSYSYQTFFRFKENENAKPVKIDVYRSNGFVVEADSFAVIKNFDFEGVGGGLNPMEMDFAQVIESGPITLYKHFSTQGNPSAYANAFGLENYIIRKNNSPSLITIRKKSKKKFKEQMAELLKERSDLLEKVQNETYTWKDTPEIIRALNAGVANQ